MILLQLLSFLSIIERDSNETLQQKKSFSFLINNDNIILTNSNQYLKNLNSEQKNWYYVHFLTKNLSNISKYIPIDSTSIILKDTFTLYLSKKQLSLISNISLIKKIEPEEKIREESESLEKAKYLLVFGPKNFELEENTNYYTIKSRKGSECYLIKFNTNSIQSKQNIIRIISEKPSVRAVVTYSGPVLKNNLMTGYTQKNTKNYSIDEKSGILYKNRYLNEKGINGEGEIVTVIDTFIDFHHAMFNDDNATFDVNKPLTHRKFVYYSYSGSVEDLEIMISENEHGTHVAGTIAGDSSCEENDKGLALFNGNAPKAKLIYISFFDVDIELEKDLMDTYNSRISSNSWDDDGFSDAENYLYGKTAHETPQNIYIFAAGNEYADGNFTVDDPSGSKNILSVGAIDDLFNTKHVTRFQIDNDPSIYFDAEQLFMTDSFYSGNISSDIGLSIVNAENQNDCSIFEDNLVFLVYSHSDSNASWVRNCSFYYSRGVFLSTEYDKVQSFVKYSKSSTVSLFDKTEINVSKPIQHSSFSSAGPGNKGAMKPDLMAPGTRILSAKSFAGSSMYHGCREDGKSDVTSMDGTSQATPNVAGAAALVRQYFLSGRWVSRVDLDGATVRALLINSCVHPMDEKSPDVLHGHGVVDLSTVIPVEGGFGVKMTYHFTSANRSHIGEFGHKVATFAVKSNKRKVQVTLSYLDAMTNKDSPLLLVRDLDLVVTSPSGRKFLGGHLEWGDTQHLSTNEKVIIDDKDVEKGTYSVHVYSGSFLDGGLSGSADQNFSVVATGDVENGFLTFVDAENCECGKCDDEHPKHCKCDDKAVGAVCQAKIETVSKTSFNVTLRPHEIRRIMLIEKNFIEKVDDLLRVNVSYLSSEDVQKRRLSTVWIDKKCHLELGEYVTTLGNFVKNDTLAFEFDKDEGSRACIAIFNNNFKETSFAVEVAKESKSKKVYLAIWCSAGALLLLVIVIVVVVSVKRCRKQRLKESGFTEIKSLSQTQE